VATALTDTDPEAERIQLELLRRATPERRLRLALSLTESVLALSRGGLAQKMPGASDEEIGVRFVELHYGAGLADELRRHLLARR
jgi:hypothetical protein